ncbi:MAG: kynureninase [Flavisolibacter sp.]|jgi:kynureninase
MNFENSLAFAQQLDDSFSSYRNAFVIPQHNGKNAIYFLGNSLGLRPKKTATSIEQILQQWDALGVEAFFKGTEPWMQYHDRLVQPLSKIVGALPHEVVVMNSLTVNLHLMLTSFYQPLGKRIKILCEAKAFCSDQYMLETHVKQRGLNQEEIIIEVHPRQGEFTLRDEDILAAIEQHKDELALVFFGGVNYYTGQVLDMQAIATAVHDAGAKAGFDLAHAAGNIFLDLHNWNADFACWCSYKYLNSGPGAIGGAYVHERYHNDLSLNRLAGWWGYNKADRFKMQKGFDPVRSAEGWQLSTPSPVLYAAHKAALDIFDEAGIEAMQQKGKSLSDYLLYLLNELNRSMPQKNIRVLTPATAKGCQVSLLMLKNGKAIFDHLSNGGVFADWREPDVIRVAPVPLYNTFEEVWRFVQLLQDACIKTGA